MLAAVLSALHVLALALGLGAVVARGLALRALRGRDARWMKPLLTADTLWGVAALLWLLTGLTRLFAGLDKSIDFYVYNGFFWLKMGLFGLLFVMEILPMSTFLRWRFQLGKGTGPDLSRLALLVRINDAETALVVAIPFVAAAMARGLWLTT